MHWLTSLEEPGCKCSMRLVEGPHDPPPQVLSLEATPFSGELDRLAADDEAMRRYC